MGRRWSYRLVIVTVMTTVAIVPALVLAIPFVQQLSRMANEHAQRELTLVAERASDRVAAAFQLLLLQAEATATDSDLHRGVQSLLFVERADLILEELVNEHELVVGSVLLNDQGEEVTAQPIALMDQGLPAQSADLPKRLLDGIVPRQDNQPDYGLELVRNKAFLLEQGRRLDRDQAASDGLLVLAVPVRGLMRRVVGTMVLYLPAERLVAIGQRNLPPAMGVELLAQQQALAAFMPPDPAAPGPLISASAAISLANPLAAQQLVLEIAVNEPHALRFGAIERAMREASGLVLIAILLMGLLSLGVAAWLVRPIRKLQQVVRRYAKGDYQQVPPAAPFRELQAVLDTMGEMGQSIVQNIAELTEQERLKGELARAQLQSELTTLRNQMSPHFLFNAFNSIGTMIGIEPRDAQGMLQKLAELYRAILDGTKRTTIPVRQELAIVRNYLDLEKMRFGDRLEYQVSCVDGTEDAWVPPLILQTIVENAVKHGIAKDRKGGQITLTIKRGADDWLMAEVTNTGAPLMVPSESSGGTGVANTRQRLELLYGERHNLRLQSSPGGETVVSFCFSGAPF